MSTKDTNGTNKIWKHKDAEPALAHESLNKGGGWFYFVPFVDGFFLK